MVQDPGESAYDGMPRAAIAATRHAKVLRLPELAAFIDQESRRPVSGQKIGPDPDLARQLSVFLEETGETGIAGASGGRDQGPAG